jgi:SAM-dependent methyltransferase
MSKLLDQCRKPTGWIGRLFLWIMNRGHSKLTDWGLREISVGKGDTILDVGCGGGETVRKLAAVAAEGKVYGIDHSEQSVALARRTNRQGIAERRVDIRQASVSGLPFSDDFFDLVTAVETHYFWPDLATDMREVLRVLKPCGTLIIIAEANKSGKHDKVLQKVAESTKMAFLTADGHSSPAPAIRTSGEQQFLLRLLLGIGSHGPPALLPSVLAGFGRLCQVFRGRRMLSCLNLQCFCTTTCQTLTAVALRGWRWAFLPLKFW